MEQQEKQQSKDGEEGYRPCIEEHNSNNTSREQRIFDNSLPGADLMTIDQCETMREMDDSQLVGPPPRPPSLPDFNRGGVVQAVTTAAPPAKIGGGDVLTTSVKRKRGRPPRIQGKTALPPPTRPPPPPPPPPPPSQSQRKKNEEEDVCFICFDGGTLVLCDRRGCPKAYHATCIKRDDAFFRSKAKWNCGWHICSSCEKASHYMCYTCTYSLCKGCTKGADYVNVRGNKGFCGTCFKTIMLIENVKLENAETVKVDFDDQLSWEYLFKIYWVCLKDKLSLTVDELTRAKNPWKGDEVPKAKNSWRGAVMVAPKEVSSGEHHHGNDGKGSSLGVCSGNMEPNNSKRRKTMDLPEGTVWATKELLDLVALMKNGDTSVLSQFDVQALLLEYIKKHNLRDPRQKSQIICDARLANMFGKPRVGHFEMLKLLEDHYLIKEKSPADDAVRVGVSGTVLIQVEAATGSHGQSVVGSDKRRKTRKKMDGRVSPVNPNPDEYAAIDVHNINLLYLKRDLMEILMEDSEKFREKVVGSFVRIRISGGDQKQDMHRLVQVVGTSKVAESYKVGSKTTDFMLEILNLNKSEVVSIDTISNQEFSEEECRRLRQSIKCGLVKQLKVGEIQEKAMVLQPVKVGNWLEAEVVRLNHLRDRASEKGHRKELKECVEKLELLKSPKECQRRLLEIPNVHADPNMDPGHDSEEDAGESNENKQGDHARARDTGIGGKGIELNSPVRENDLNDIGNSGLNNLVKACEQSRNACTTFYVDKDGTTRVHEGVSESTWRQGDGALGPNVDDTSKNQLSSDSVNGQAAVKSETLTGVVSSVTPHQPSGGEQFVSDVDEEKLWHYQDPSGKIQGPFSVAQLRKWSTIGLFPLDFRVWKIDEKQEDSVLLTDALSGRFSKQPSNSHLEPGEAKIASNDAGQNIKCELSQSTVASWLDNKRVDNDGKPVQNNVNNIQGVGDGEFVNSNNGLASHSSTLSKAVDLKMDNDAQDQSSLRGWDLSKSWIAQSQIHGSISSAASSPGKPFENPSPQVREGHGDEKWSSNVNSHRNIDEKRERSDSDGLSNQSSGQNWGGQPIKSSPSRWDSNSGGFLSAAKTVEKPEPHQEIDFSDLLSPRPKQSHENLKDDAAKSKLPLASNDPVQDSRPTWSTASNLVVGGGQFLDIAGEWGGGGYSSHTKPSVEEWDSNHVSASSMKTTEGGAIDHAATPTSGTAALTVSSSTHPTIDTSDWQPIVAEPNEFCSLVDESVSDLLAEVEAMESLGGLPSPTSKLNCGGELTPGSDNDCFSPVETFSSAPDPGKSDALSSTGDIRLSSTQLPTADVVLRLSHTPSQPTLTNEPLAVSQMPSQLAMTDKHNPLSQMPPRSIVQDEPLGTSPMPCQSTLTDEPLGLWHTNILDAQKSFSRHSPRSGHKKLSEISVNQWEPPRSEPQASPAVSKGESGSHYRGRASSSVGQWETGSELQLPVSTAADTNYGTMKGNVNLNRGVSQGNTNMAWGTGQGTVQQQQPSSNSAGILGSWGSQSRHGGDNRLSSSRDNRNYHHHHHHQQQQGRDSGYGKDRSSWNRQPAYGAGSGGGGGGGSYKAQGGKGQRVCKFYENGHCKKGASCSYLHP